MRASIAVGIVVISLSAGASAEPLLMNSSDTPGQAQPMVAAASQPQANLGGGFIEFLFGDQGRQTRSSAQDWYGPPPEHVDGREENVGRGMYANAPAAEPMQEQRWDGRMDPQFLRQEVGYGGKEAPGTV